MSECDLNSTNSNSLFGSDRESREHEETMTTDITEEFQPAKVPLLPKDIVNSKKVNALRKEQKRKLGRQRSMGSAVDYPTLPIDKHEPEFVSISSKFYTTFNQLGHVDIKRETVTVGGECDWSPSSSLVSSGSMQKETGRNTSADEGHIPCVGSVSVPS